MEKDIRRFFSKYTSMSNIKTGILPKCESDIEEVQRQIDANEFSPAKADDYQRGLAYFFGIGDIRDDEAGLRYLKLAADDGNADAMNMYGFACYHTSLGSKENPQKQEWYEKQALKYFTEAAQTGQSEALFNLGVCYTEGKCTEENEKLGLTYIRKAIEKHHPKAELYLEEYQAKRGQGPQIDREIPKEEAFAKIAEEMKREAGDGPIYLTGLFNDIYLEKGYKWIRHAALGWICSKDDGQSFLIRESELEEIGDSVLSVVETEAQ